MSTLNKTAQKQSKARSERAVASGAPSLGHQLVEMKSSVLVKYTADGTIKVYVGKGELELLPNEALLLATRLMDRLCTMHNID